jgi:hypothetical protein
MTHGSSSTLPGLQVGALDRFGLQTHPRLTKIPATQNCPQRDFAQLQAQPAFRAKGMSKNKAQDIDLCRETEISRTRNLRISACPRRNQTFARRVAA